MQGAKILKEAIAMGCTKGLCLRIVGLLYLIWGGATCLAIELHANSNSNSNGLEVGFYKQACPQAESVVKSVLERAIQRNARVAAFLLRMHFHDCFVQGCDASIMLDDTPSFKGEKTAVPNLNSIKGFDVIDEIKSAVEAACPHVVSCADILAIAARDSVVLTGGPTWDVPLGRRDSRSASLTGANQNLPPPTSNVPQLIQFFQNVGLNVQDMVALSGGHTIGRSRCTSFSVRLNVTSTSKAQVKIQDSLRIELIRTCGGTNATSGNNGNITAPLDKTTWMSFDNQYFKNLMHSEGLLNSDQVLFSTPGETRKMVMDLSGKSEHFFETFATSMVKMGNINPLTGNLGEIRTNCRKTN